MESCINKDLTSINRRPVYSEHNRWSKGGSIYTGFTVNAIYALFKVDGGSNFQSIDFFDF